MPIVGDWKMLGIAIIVSAVSGFLRGFTGFGSALFFVPAMAAIYDPRVAATTLVAIDIFSSAWHTFGERKICNWREVRFLTTAALVGAVAGAFALSHANPIVLRWLASGVVLLVLALVSGGWRYRGNPTGPLTVAVGLLSGFLGGAVAMEGPPAVLFWLAGSNAAAVTRANVMMFILLTEAVVFCLYVIFGLMTPGVFLLAIILLPFFWISFWVGSRKFHGASDRIYRRVAGAVIALSAIASLFVHNGAG